MKQHSGKKEKKNGGRNNEVAFFVRELAPNGASAHLRRRIAYTQALTAITSNNVSNAYTSGTVNSCTAWAGLAADYNEFRVRAIRATLHPRYQQFVNFATAPSTPTLAFPGNIIVTRSVAGLAPPSIGAAVDWDGFRIFESGKAAVILCTWDSNPTAKLWTLTATVGALPTDRYLGVYFANFVTAYTAINGLVHSDVVVEYDVEFRGRSA